MNTRPCPLCSSTDVTWRKRRLTDVLATWLRYATDFVFGAGLKGGQFHKAGELATYTYKDTKTFDAPNRADVGDSFHYSNTTHQALATPRWFWHCHRCGDKGEVFDESVTAEAD